MLRRIGRFIFVLIPLWSGRIVMYGTLVASILVGGCVLGLRYWVLPNIESYRGNLEAALSKAAGQRISIGEISADWAGWRPRFSLGRVTVYDSADRPALVLSRMDNALSWLSLLVLEPRFYSVAIHQPQLAIRRAADGTLSVAGIVLDESADGGGFVDWLIRQREIVISRASVSWIDERRAAPELRLSELTLKLQNEFHRHRFGLRATAASELAGALDVRGDFVGRSLKRVTEWEGQLFLQLDRIDLAGWRQWVDLPIEIAQGRGALRAWVDIARQRVTNVVADVRLAEVRARLAPELEELALAELSGRVGWRDWSSGFQVSARGLDALAVAGHSFRSDDFLMSWRSAQGGNAPRGELQASALDLEALARITAYLPVDAGAKAMLTRFEPRGKVYDLSVKWSGQWPPAQYQIKGRFEQLGVNAVDGLPGLTGVTGTVDANDKRGTATLAKSPLRIELPRVFEQPLSLDEASGQMQWSAAAGRYDIRMSELKFANADLAGTLQGSYQYVPGEPGNIDVSGALSRADARKLPRYVPLVVDRDIREWLQRALIAGRGSDVKLTLKGPLADFPFDRRKSGIFRVSAKAYDGILQYDKRWPRIENIVTDLVVNGGRMEIRASEGTILGTRIGSVKAVIPDLSTFDEILELNGDTNGATAEFLRFIAESPVAEMIDHFTDGMEGQGAGRLALRLTVPLRRVREARVAGRFEFLDNRLMLNRDFPSLENVSGHLDFTESGARAEGVSAQIFGGPALVSAETQGDVVTITTSGHAQLQALRKTFASPIMDYLSGSADWRSSIRLRGKLAEFTVESGLEGVASSLPAPLAKSADDNLPLRIERRVSASSRDQIDVRLGKLLAVRLLRNLEGTAPAVERVAIGLGVDPPDPQRPGISVRGSVASFDFDRWRTLARSGRFAAADPAPEADVQLKFGALDALGRRFNDVGLSLRSQGRDWHAHVAGSTLDGDITWRPQGKGQVVARLRRLVLPAALGRIEAPQIKPPEPPVEHPALDVVVEDFSYKGRSLGRLGLVAQADGRNWLVEQLQVRNADGTLTADGFWQWQAKVPRTRLNFRLQVSDIGGYLKRMGYPEGVKGGTANLDGRLSWAGAPQDLDIPSLDGDIKVEAAGGRFVKLEPGIGKLLSILSLQALPRRVTLDFKDVFSEGFSFDTIAGVAKVAAGVARTDGFRIRGSAASVVMSGQVDLARETQALRVRVTPAVGDSVSAVTALLGGPVAGIGVFLAQKLLNDPLGQMIAYDYSVTGTWSDPSVVKIAAAETEPG